MTLSIAALMRHGAYDQPPGVPWAHLPYGLTEPGRAEAAERCGRAFDVLGGSRFAMDAPLDVLMLLDWSDDSSEPVRFEQVDLAERRDLLPDIMKAPGPFYLPSGGSPPPAPLELDPEQYLHHLAPVTAIEASGGVDFEEAMDVCGRAMRAPGVGW